MEFLSPTFAPQNLNSTSTIVETLNPNLTSTTDTGKSLTEDDCLNSVAVPTEEAQTSLQSDESSNFVYMAVSQLNNLRAQKTALKELFLIVSKGEKQRILLIPLKY